MASKRFTVATVVAGLCLLPACSSDDSSDAAGGGEANASIAYEVKETGADSARLDGPASAPAGVVDITLRNAGELRHDAQLIRVDGQHSADDVIESFVRRDAKAKRPSWGHVSGGVGPVPAGRSATVTEVLEPGTYYVIDIQTGGRAKPPSPPRAWIAKLNVTGGDSGGELPSTEARITADEYSFDSSGLKPGRNRVTFENAGEQPHHVIALPIAKGATFAKAKEAVTSNQPSQGKPPVDYESFVGTAVIDGGEEQVTELDLPRGRYALVCFVTDSGGGKPHAELGMVSELDVR